jgi:hypothetical protein
MYQIQKISYMSAAPHCQSSNVHKPAPVQRHGTEIRRGTENWRHPLNARLNHLLRQIQTTSNRELVRESSQNPSTKLHLNAIAFYKGARRRLRSKHDIMRSCDSCDISPQFILGLVSVAHVFRAGRGCIES